MSRPQDKHLIPLTERTEEEAHAIRSAGGKASQQKRKEKQMMADLLELYSGLPITDKRKKNTGKCDTLHKCVAAFVFTAEQIIVVRGIA